MVTTKEKDEIDTTGKDEETTPESELETTPEPEEQDKDEDTITLTRKELNDKVSAAGVEIGRALKAATDANKALKGQYDQTLANYNDLRTELDTVKRTQREKEISDAQGDKGLVDTLTLRHQAEDLMDQARKKNSDAETLMAQYQADIDAAAKSKAEVEANELAKTSGLTADLLLQIGSDTDDKGRVTYNLERMKTIAKSVPKAEESGEGGEEEAGTGNSVRGQRARAAKARNAGTKGLNTMEDYDVAYNEGLISIEEYSKARERFGIV